MSFTSYIADSTPVYNDHNYQELLKDVVIDGETMGRGYTERDWYASPFGTSPYVVAMDFDRIPRSEWTDRIEEIEKTDSLTSSLMDYRNIPILGQGKTNYCWCNGVVDAMHAIRAKNGLKFVYLSPASAAAKIKNYRNKGGWGIQAIEGINEHGVCSVDLWPANAISRQYDTSEARENAKLHTIPEFYEIPPHDFEAVMSCLLRGFPVPAGLLWWGHLVDFVDPVVIGRDTFGVRFRNSWTNRWGDKGYGILEESKATPDEATAPRTVTLSEV